jgi:3-oxoacyl-[acyl-carrier protein] reductase
VDLGLTGKVAMVAGASRGLGLAVARRLAAEGARVSMCSRDQRAVCEAARSVAAEFGADLLPFAADVRQPDRIRAWHEATLERFGTVDLLFVNSGGPPAGSTLDFDDAAWQDAFELLLLSAVRLVRAAVPTMKANGGGAIVFATSSGVKEPIAGLALSNVLRAGVAALAKTLSQELAPSGIRVNTLVPGRIDTDRVRELDQIRSRKAGIPVEEQRTRSVAAIPLGRYGDPDEFARAAAFLLSDASRYTTGAVLQIDGGLIRSVL